MGNLCGASGSTATPPPPALVGCKEEAFMACILEVKVTKQGWQRSVRRLLGNIKEVKKYEMDESGRVEVSAIGNSDKVLKKIGKSGKLEVKYIKFGQCSGNLFIQESSKEKPKPQGQDNNNNYYHYPLHPHPHQMITRPGPYGYQPYGYGYDYGNQYGYNGYGSGYRYPTQLTPYYSYID